MDKECKLELYQFVYLVKLHNDLLGTHMIAGAYHDIDKVHEMLKKWGYYYNKFKRQWMAMHGSNLVWNRVEILEVPFDEYNY